MGQIVELYQLKTFVTVADEGHLTRAAERLNTSQPAISAHIKALESELGIVLFDRTPKGMRLTTHGEMLKEKAEKILKASDELKFTAETIKDVLTGDVRLGLHTEARLLKIAEILSAFQRNYPSITVNFQQKMSWQAPPEIIAGNLDAAFVYSKPDDDKIAVHRLDEVQLLVVAPLAWQERLTDARVEDLTLFPWVWTDKYCPLYQAAHKIFAEIGREPVKAVIVDQESAIYKLVTAGVGLSLMPESKAKEAAEAGELYITEIPAPKIDLSLIYLKSREQDPMISAIFEIINLVWQSPSLLDRRDDCSTELV
ncbi:MAG: LysR family transcriptional regulator [Crocosphaera sp.]|nr:LysR family transcriptional regulator [Crocosphaera sp.]